jgi:hypothetical protein
MLETMLVSATMPPNTGRLTEVGFLGRGMLGTGGFDIEPGALVSALCSVVLLQILSSVRDSRSARSAGRDRTAAL